jgi:DNA-binding NarL/FixJ family response regulator
MDYQMPFVDGIAAAKILKVKYPSIRIIILSLFQNEHLIAELFENGVTGYVSKNIEPTELFLAIENVLDGKKYIQKSY